MRHVFQQIDREPGLIESLAALDAITKVGLQGCYPKAHLVVDEEIDFVWKQMSVIHGVSVKDVRTVANVGFSVTSFTPRSPAVLSQVLQRLPQLMPGAMDVGLHRTQG